MPINSGNSGHFTASAVVIALGHVLLVHHKRIGAWLPPGGHINQTEMPHQAAFREVLEETGIEIEILSEPVPATEDNDAFFPPQPICIHIVKAHENNIDVYHFDIAYLAKPKLSEEYLSTIHRSQEINEARWFRLEEVGDIGKYPVAKNVPELITLAKAKMNLLNL